MSAVTIRKALETALASITPALATTWENVPFTPVVGTPYQRVAVVFAEPANDEFGRFHEERGFMQITLAYPPGNGPKDAFTRADLIRTTFFRGASFPAGGLVTTITRTPTLLPAMSDDDGRYLLPVRVPFHAFIKN